jgi:UTP:GlnB (protein PII) uridylyltransferase
VLRLVRKQAAADGKEVSLTVVALGRYGQELLMLVLDHGRQRPASESLARQVVHGLGCLGLQLAASIMGPRECLAFARDEAAVQASLMGARYLGGSYGPWAKLQAELDAVLWGGPPAARPR